MSTDSDTVPVTAAPPAGSRWGGGSRLYPTWSERIEFVCAQPCLTQDAPEGTNGYLAVVRNDGGADSFSSLLCKLDMAAPLTDLDEPCRFDLRLTSR